MSDLFQLVIACGRPTPIEPEPTTPKAMGAVISISVGAKTDSDIKRRAGEYHVG